LHGDEDGRLAGGGGHGAGRHARIGQHQIDVRLEMLRDAEVVQRHGEEQRVGAGELVCQLLGQGDRGDLDGRGAQNGRGPSKFRSGSTVEF
jgi:hypothetical protein